MGYLNNLEFYGKNQFLLHCAISVTTSKQNYGIWKCIFLCHKIVGSHVILFDKFSNNIEISNYIKPINLFF